MIKAVLMDMDGTMYDTERLSTIGWQKAAEETGCPLTTEQIWAFRGRNQYRNCDLFCTWYHDADLYWKMRAIRLKFINGWIDGHGVPLKNGLFELLGVLRDKQIPVCIATGTSREAASGYWEKTGVLPYVAATICGDEVTLSKPDPDMFLKAAAKVHTPPAECLVLEDSPNGGLAAVRAGSPLILIPDETPIPADVRAQALAVCPSLSDVAELFRSGKL